MRKRYIQVDDELLAEFASDLSVSLDCDVLQAIGHTNLLISWAMNRCPRDRPPSASAYHEGPLLEKQLARACLYKGDPAVFVDAYCTARPAMLERVGPGLRFKGLDRYDALWAKNYKEAAKAWRAAHPEWRAKPREDEDDEPEGKPPVSARTPPGTPTETSPLDPDLDPDPDLLKPPPPPVAAGKPEKHVAMTPEALAFWESMVVPLRRARGLKSGDPPRKFAAWYVACRSEGLTEKQLSDALDLYMDDPDFARKQWPVAIFIKPSVFRWRLRERPEKAFAPAQNPEWSPDTPAGGAFVELVDRLRRKDASYAAHHVEQRLVPELRDGHLVLLTPDLFALEWFRENYTELVAPAVFDLGPPREAA